MPSSNFRSELNQILENNIIASQIIGTMTDEAIFTFCKTLLGNDLSISFDVAKNKFTHTSNIDPNSFFEEHDQKKLYELLQKYETNIYNKN